MTTQQAILAIAVMAAVTLLLRAAPFLFFAGRPTPKTLLALGKSLPYAMMGMLVVYCLKDVRLTSPGGFLPELIASAVTVAAYVWKRNSLVSILGGTACYMLLVQLVF